MPNVYGNSNMTTCDTCPLREGCSERIGLCNAYLQYQKRVERIRKQIEKLNETKEASAEIAVPANEGGREPSLLRQPCRGSDILREELTG